MGSSFVKTPVQSTATKVQSSSGRDSIQRTPSLISLASDAAASLAEASKIASSGGNSLPQCKHRWVEIFFHLKLLASIDGALQGSPVLIPWLLFH